MKYKGLLVSVLLLCSAWGQAWAVDRYTTPDGLTSGTCAVDVPCTLLRVTSAAQPGDTVYVGPGTYSEGINTGNASVVYTCPTGLGTCIIDGVATLVTNVDRTIKIDVNSITIEKMVVMTRALDNVAHKYGITIENGVTGAIVRDNIVTSDLTSDPSDLTYNQWGIFARGTGFIVDGNTVKNVQIGISANTDAGIPTGTISDNTISDLTPGDPEDSDCFSVGSTARDMSYGLTIERNDCSDYRDDGIDMLSSSNMIVQDNWIHDSANSTTANSGIKAGRETSTGNIIRRNFVDVRGGNTITDDYCMVVPGLSSGFFYSNVMITDDASTCVEMSEWTSGGGGGDNNTFINNTFVGELGFFLRDSATGNVTKNNIFKGAVGDVKVDTGMTLTGTRDDLAGTGTATGGGTYSGTGTLTVSPGWVGGTSPTTASGFKLKVGSALRRAGKGLGIPVSDYVGRPFYPSAPSIGAYEVTSNSEATDRTAATARTARN